MKKIAGIFVIFVLFFILNTAVIAAKTDLTLEVAVEMAVEQSNELEKASLTLEKAQLEYKKNRANNLLTQSKYSELQTEYQLRTAENNYREAEYNVVNDIIQQYSNLWLSELDLQIRKRSVELEKRLLEEAESQYNIGDIGTIDLLEQENTYKDAEFDLENFRNDYRQEIRNFRIDLGLNEKDINLTGLPRPEVWQIGEEEAIELALKNDHNLLLSKEDVKLAKLDLDRAKVSSSSLDIQIKEVELELAEVEVENITEEITDSTREAYYQFKQSIENIELKKKRLNEARDKYKLQQRQYEAGLVTNKDLLQYEVNLMEAESQYRNAISNYYTSEQALKQAVNLETGVLANDDEK